MPNPTPQERAVSALLTLIGDEYLPPCQWIVYHAFGLEGWVSDLRDTDPLLDVQVWAVRLRSEVKRDLGSRILYVNGVYDGVPVSIRAKERDGSYR